MDLHLPAAAGRSPAADMAEGAVAATVSGAVGMAVAVAAMAAATANDKSRFQVPGGGCQSPGA